MSAPFDRLRQAIRQGTLVRTLSMNMAYTVVDVGCQTVTTLLVARLFGPALFGKLGLFLTGIQLLGMLMDGMLASQTRLISEQGATDRSQAWKLGWGSTGLLVLLAGGTGLLLAGGYAAMAPERAASEALLLALAVGAGLTRLARSAVENACRALGHHDVPVRWGLGFAVLQAAVVLGAVTAGGRVEAYLGLLFGLQGLAALCLAWSYRGLAPNPIPSEAPRGAYQGMMLYGLPLVFRGFAGFFYIKVNTPLIGHYAGEEALGYFRLAEQFLLMPQLIATAATMTYSPLVGDLTARGDHAGLARVTGRLYGGLLLFSIPISLLFLLSPFIVAPLFPRFEPASAMIQRFALLPAFVILANVASVLLMQRGKGGLLTLLSVLAGIANTAAVYLAVQSGGALGAATATIAVHLVTSCLTLTLAHTTTGIPFRLLIPGLSRPAA